MAAHLAQAQSEVDEITVTGSRIARRDFQANSPITTVDAQRFEDSSTVAIESVINQLPQFVPAINQFDAGGYTQGAFSTPGAATVSLRGLGSNRNLVLLDGRRAMPVNASMAVSVNTIPGAAIARVETITGGASSVYGADAVAGVVNFITKKDYQGVTFDYQRSETMRGDAAESRISALFGANFGQTGNVMIGFERSSRDELLKADRPFYTDGWADPTVAGTQTFWSDPGMETQVGNLPSSAVVQQIFAGATSTVPNNNIFYLNRDGTVYKTQPQGAFRYNGPTLTPAGDVWRKTQTTASPSTNGQLVQNRDYELAQIPLERYSTYAHAHLDVTDHVSAFADALFSENTTRAVGEDSPLLGGWRSSVPHGAGLYAPSVDTNGNTRADYLPGGRFGLNCPAVGGCTKSQAWPTPPELTALLDSRPNPEGDFEFRILSSWAGPRRTDIQTQTYQVTSGFEGDLREGDWTWEAYLSHGQTTTSGEYGGMVSLQRWRFVTGQPNYGAGMFYTGNELGAGFSAGTSTCSSGFPIVSYFTPSQDCQDAVGATAKTSGRMEQDIAEFNLQGGITDLPAGDLRFAAGLSYRKNTFEFFADTLNTQFSVLDLPAGVFPSANSKGETISNDLYGELSVPLLANKKAAKEMMLELGYRHSNNDPSNNVNSYKALLDWRIVNRIRFRGGRQVANRAPNVAELFQSAEQQVLFSPYGDWCSDVNPNNPLSPNPSLNPNAAQVRAICAARMGAGAAVYYDPSYARSSDASQWRFSDLTGNPNLLAEQAETYTAGIVADITDQLTFTFDYWRIGITDMISAQGPDSLYSRCFSPVTNPTFDPTYSPCLQIQRNPNDGTQANAKITYTNTGAVDTRGYDLQLDWSRQMGPGRLSVNWLATVLDRMATRVEPGAKWTDWTGTSGPGDIVGLNAYAYDYKLYTTVGFNSANARWSGSVRWRHLPSIMSLAELTNPNATFEPAGTYDIFDVSGRYVFAEKWQLRFGIDNLFDRDPELTFADAVTSAAGTTNASQYDILGRRAYVGFSVDL
jgi:outer membrane receptor protein involved in Fe transport